MALTATANLATRKMVIRSLEMNGCYIKARNPKKSNIRYTVAEKPVDILTIVKPVVKHIIEKGQEADRCSVVPTRIRQHYLNYSYLNWKALECYLQALNLDKHCGFVKSSQLVPLQTQRGRS
jgi:hypothetical protein